jgi:hypothetical protein
MKISRIFLDDRQLHVVSPVLDDLGLTFFLSPDKYLFDQDAGKGGFSNSVSALLPDTSPLGSFMVHLGRDVEAVLAAREADFSSDDRALGNVLGIPVCCVDAFVRNAEAAAAAQNDFTLFACRSTCGQPDPWAVNCAHYFGYGLVSHFPCSMTCRKTSSMAKAAARLLYDNVPELAAEFMMYNACSYLYTEYDGVYAFLEQPNRQHGGWRYNARRLEMSNNGLLSEALGKGDRLDVRSPSDFTICAGMSEVMTVCSETAFLLFHEQIVNLEKL